jgi:hypothetical protein
MLPLNLHDIIAASRKPVCTGWVSVARGSPLDPRSSARASTVAARCTRRSSTTASFARLLPDNRRPAASTGDDTRQLAADQPEDLHHRGTLARLTTARTRSRPGDMRQRRRRRAIMTPGAPLRWSKACCGMHGTARHGTAASTPTVPLPQVYRFVSGDGV